MISNRYTKKERLLKRFEYVKLSNSEKKFHSNHFIAVAQKNHLERTRIGITVTKRVGNAVTRNRIKRLTREFFRNNKNKIEKNLDINIIAKMSAKSVKSEFIFKSLNDIFDKLAVNFDN